MTAVHGGAEQRLEGGARERTDGRTLRSQRTRAAVIDALLSLIEEGDVRPTAPRIAERAGVSLRSVFQHFNDLEALHAAVVRRKLEEVALLVRVVDPALPLPERLAAFVDQRANVLEMITPVRRAALAHVPLSREGQLGQDTLLAMGRESVARAFQPELDRCPPDERDELLEALNLALGWQVWESLRAYAKLDVERSKAVVLRMLRALLRTP